MENEKPKGFQRKNLVILLLILFWPLGLAALAMNKTFRKSIKTVLFIIFGLIGAFQLLFTIITLVEYQEGSLIERFHASIRVFSGLEEDEEEVVYPQLLPGQSMDGFIDMNQDPYQIYRVEIPETALGIRISITDATEDLDLDLHYGDDISEDADFHAHSSDSLEVLYLYKQYESWFPSGEYLLQVMYQDQFHPRENGKKTDELPYTVRYDTFDAVTMGQPLFPDTPIEGVANYESGYLAHYVLKLPPETDAFRIDVLDTPGDIDLYLSLNNPAPLHDEFLVIAGGLSGAESIIVDTSQIIANKTADSPDEGETESSGNKGAEASGEEETESPQDTEQYYLTVMGTKNPLELDGVVIPPIPFRLMAALGTAVPDTAPSPPILPLDNKGFDAARLATVELFSPSGSVGSGSLIGSDGLIITNKHVARDGGKTPDMLVGITLESSMPSKVLFIAEVVQLHPEEDLALLRITKDRWERPLPEGYRFPAQSVGNSASLIPGDTLMVLGYPIVGSGITRSYYTLSKGIFSGVEASSYKTDALLAPGSSGGPVFDENWNMVGVGVRLAAEHGANLSFFIPQHTIPDEWLTLKNK